MAYSTKIPSIKVKISIEKFNKLVEVLSIQSGNTDDYISKKSTKLKEKLLKYSVPKEDGEEKFVDIRFYQNEVLDMFKILFDGVKDEIDPEEDYYQILLESRNKFNKNDEE